MEAATRVFIESGGFRRTQIGDVAKAMGVAKGTLYLYVESKEALFDLALRHADRELPEPPLPVPTPAPGATVSYVRERMAERARFDALSEAERRGGPKDMAAELSAVVDEVYAALADNRTAIKLIGTSAHDLPELGELWYRRARGALNERIALRRGSPAPDARPRGRRALRDRDRQLVRGAPLLGPVSRRHRGRGRARDRAHRDPAGAPARLGAVMSVEPALLGFAAVIFLSYAVQTVTGFGSMLLAVTFGAHLLGIREIVTLAVPISMVQTGYIVWRHRDGIAWRLLLRRILPLMGLGMALGFSAFAGTESVWLRYGFAVMVLVLAARELWLRVRASADPKRVARPMPAAASVAAMFGAGIIHGIYATGGPMLVYALGRESLSKHAFRSTLSAVWLVLNAGLLIGFSIEGRYAPAVGLDLLVLLPAVPLGVALGEWVHHRVDQRRFELAIFSLLIAAAISLLIR